MPPIDKLSVSIDLGMPRWKTISLEVILVSLGTQMDLGGIFMSIMIVQMKCKLNNAELFLKLFYVYIQSNEIGNKNYYNCLSCVQNCDDQLHLYIILCSSNIWTLINSLVKSTTKKQENLKNGKVRFCLNIAVRMTHGWIE